MPHLLSHVSAFARGVRLRRLLLGVGTTLALGGVGAARAGAQTDDSAAATRAKFDAIPWVAGPATGRLGDVAQLRVPATCRYTEAAGARSFLEITENIPSGRELGALYCPDKADGENSWFVIYSYDPSGYVKDDEKGALDADAILASIRRGTEEGNAERRARGWDEMTVEGWVRAPHYDQRTNNLTWSFTGGSTSGGKSVNHSVRLLGRGGVLHADLVLDPSQLGTVVADFDQVVAGTTFTPGNRYAEWREGDKVAAYGLTALVAGGAGAVAVKTGLFAKLGKLLAAFGKVIMVVALGLLATLKNFIQGLFRRSPQKPGGASAPGQS